MATKRTERSDFFPAIEKKHGQPMTFWFDQMKEIADWKYPEQIAFLREEHGFSQAHANALVLYCRGSTSARRYQTLDEYLEPFDEVKQTTVRNVIRTILDAHPELESVIAWNHPMLKYKDHYVFGISVHTNHILIAPWSSDVLEDFADRLVGYHLNKKTIKVPVDWMIDTALLQDIIAASMLHVDREITSK